ncbi:MAG TPA: hypothetical protein VL595_34975 [Pseudonocardia sp.]|nr:hypothetical protein [Pseudonocardia sp.]
MAILGLAGTGAPAADAASAAGPAIFNVHIVSAGLAINFHDPNLVLQPDVSVGPYTALATLDNLGQSTAQAGAPFLGDYVGPLFGHYNGLAAGQAPPSPPVPGEVHSSYPGQPNAVQRNSGYSIEATSSEKESKGVVALGPQAPGAANASFFSVADALVDRRGALRAVGTAGADALNLGPLDIGRVSSIITMTQTGSGAPKFLTSTDVGTITVSGQKFGLNEKGLTAAGGNSGASPAQVNQATESLKNAGLSIRYVPGSVTYAPGTRTIQSMESGAVAISYQQEVPSQGLVTNTFTLGYVQVSATASSFGSAASSRSETVAPATGNASTLGAAPGSRASSAPEPASVAHPVTFSTDSLPVAHRMRAAQRSGAGDEQSVAIITPTLRFLRFGSTLGLPDGCNIFFGALGAGAAEAGGGSDAGSALSSGVDGCTQLGNAGGEQLTAAMASVAPLAVINPAIDPGIDAFADALESVGNDHAAEVAPFGPTIAGMGSSARFFKGCETC